MYWWVIYVILATTSNVQVHICRLECIFISNCESLWGILNYLQQSCCRNGFCELGDYLSSTTVNKSMPMAELLI